MDAERRAHLERILANKRRREGSAGPVPLQEGLEEPSRVNSSRATGHQGASPPPVAPPASTASRNTATADSPAPARAAASDDKFLGRVAAMIRPADPDSIGRSGVASGAPPLAAASSGAAAPSPLTRRLRSASVVSAVESVETTETQALTNDPNALFVKGRFDNFTKRPTLVVDASAIKPYRSDRRLVASTRSQSPAPRSVEAVALDHLPVTEPNPFRTQSFEAFVLAPDYAMPPAVEATLQRATRHMTTTRNHRAQTLSIPGLDGKREQSPQATGDPYFQLQDAVRALSEGDWFLKWTRRKDKIHRRFFWLGNDDTLYWAKAPGIVTLLASCIRLPEVVQIETSSQIDPESGRTFYIMTLWSVSRAAQIGTEISAKFDLWYETLKRLTAVHREHNLAYYSRHATMQPVKHTGREVPPTAFHD